MSEGRGFRIEGLDAGLGLLSINMSVHMCIHTSIHMFIHKSTDEGRTSGCEL